MGYYFNGCQWAIPQTTGKNDGPKKMGNPQTGTHTSSKPISKTSKIKKRDYLLAKQAHQMLINLEMING
jgi:hypothetical protein